RDIRLPVNTGVRTDTFAESVPLVDMTNLVLLPDGSGLAPRQGFEIRRNDSPLDAAMKLDPRKKITFVHNPPDLPEGTDMIMIMNNKFGDHRVECSELVNGVAIPDQVEYGARLFSIDNMGFDQIMQVFLPATQVNINVGARGDSSRFASCRIWTEDGSLVSGVD